MASKNVLADAIESWYDGTLWRDSSSEGSVWTWDNSYTSSGGYKVARVSFPSMAIGSGTITAATLFLKTATCNYPYDGASMNMRVAASNTADAYSENINSGYTSATKTFSSDTEISFNVLSIIPDISDVNADFYLFCILDTGDSSAETEFQRWSGSYSEYQPVLAIEYTPAAGSTIGLYNGSTFTDRIIKKRVAGAWVDCDCYKYNGSSWEKVSTT
jgi:hypothetical protein